MQIVNRNKHDEIVIRSYNVHGENIITARTEEDPHRTFTDLNDRLNVGIVMEVDKPIPMTKNNKNTSSECMLM